MFPLLNFDVDYSCSAISNDRAQPQVRRVCDEASDDLSVGLATNRLLNKPRNQRVRLNVIVPNKYQKVLPCDGTEPARTAVGLALLRRVAITIA